MSYYTRAYPTLKEAIQGAIPYSADLEEALADTEVEMGADWAGLSGDTWTAEFLAVHPLYCLEVAPATLWGITVAAGVVTFLKRTNPVATFKYLSNTTWEANLPDLGLDDWTKHN